MSSEIIAIGGSLQRKQILARWPQFQAAPPDEKSIMAQWTESGSPVVTIICSTFNQSGLIIDAIYGFLSQRTSFPFEVVLRDDASTDGTQDVIRHFILQYPRIIRAVFNKENRYERGVFPVYDRPALISGEFVALCDGDDVWLDPEKLQRQVDQLRHNPDVVLSAGGTLVLYEKQGTVSVKGEVNIELIYPRLPTKYHHTSTYVFRSEPYIDVIQNHLIPNGLHGDTPVRSLILLHGKIAAVPGVLSMYHVTGSGMWSTMDKLQQQQEHVRIFATLVRVLPWRHKIKELARLRMAARSVVKLRGLANSKGSERVSKFSCPSGFGRFGSSYLTMVLMLCAIWTVPRKVVRRSQF